MTQRFLEDGKVERVTVLEAGPCPVTGIRTVERDGYEAVQLAFAPCKEKVLTKAELGHLKKADTSAHRVVREFRNEAGELLMGETVNVEAFAPGDVVKVSGTSKGKGFQGTIKRHNFASGPKSHGSHNVRAPGSIGASATPSRVFKGIRGPGPHGRRPHDPARPDGRRGDPEAESAARPGRCSRSARRHRGGADRWLARQGSEAGRRHGHARRRRVRGRDSTCRSCTRPCAPS